jgi:hypothetical protein
MNRFEQDEYYLQINDSVFVFKNISDVGAKIFEDVGSAKGKIAFSADDGPRPWWQRFIFGAARYNRPYFRLEWSSDVYALIFYDDNASEYRVLSNVILENASEQLRKEISFGESQPLPIKYCISKDIVLRAIKEFLNSGERPQWLEYEFVE